MSMPYTFLIIYLVGYVYAFAIGVHYFHKYFPNNVFNSDLLFIAKIALASWVAVFAYYNIFGK